MRALLRVGVVALEVLPLVSYTSSYIRYGGYRVAQRDCSASKAREVQVKSTAETRHRLYCTLRNVSAKPIYIHVDKTALVIDNAVRYQPASVLNPNESTTTTRMVRFGQRHGLTLFNTSALFGDRATTWTNIDDVADQYS